MNDAFLQLRDRSEELAEAPEGRSVNARVKSGKNGTFNLLADLPGGSPGATLMGVYPAGRMWSYSKAKLGDWSAEFAKELMKIGIEIEYRNDEFSYWKMAGPGGDYELDSRKVPKIIDVLQRLFSKVSLRAGQAG